MREVSSKMLSSKHEEILKVLEEAGKEGIWLRELARRTHIPKSTLWDWFKKYRNEYFANVETLRQIPRTTYPFLILVRLKTKKG